MFDPQTKKLCSAVVDAIPNLSEEMMQAWIGNPVALQNAMRLALCSGTIASAPIDKVPLDTTIRVDRSIPPIYPDWKMEVMHSELEALGPAEYDIVKVELWLHDGQKSGKSDKGTVIYQYLKDTGMLKTCFGLRDLEEIQKKGIAFFRKHFQGKAIFAWKGVVRNRYGRLHVPCLYGRGGKVVLCWDWLGDAWVGRHPALRLAS